VVAVFSPRTALPCGSAPASVTAGAADDGDAAAGAALPKDGRAELLHALAVRPPGHPVRPPQRNALQRAAICTHRAGDPCGPVRRRRRREAAGLARPFVWGGKVVSGSAERLPCGLLAAGRPAAECSWAGVLHSLSGQGGLPSVAAGAGREPQC